MATINLLPPEPQGMINLAPTLSPTARPEVLQDRAEKADYALGPDSPGVEPILSNLHLGGEGQIRQNASLTDAINDRQKRNQNVQTVARQAASEGRPISAEEADYVRQQSVSVPVDPNVILEDLHARRFVASLEEYPDWGSFEEAFEETPKAAVTIRDAGKEFLTKQAIAQRIFEEAEERQSQNNLLQSGLDVVKQAIPGYQLLQETGRIQGTGASANLFVGQNKAEQFRGLYLLPPAEFEARLREAVSTLSEENALEAVSFAAGAVSYGGDDAAWDNVFAAMDVADLATLGGTAVLATAGAGARYARRMKSVVQGSAKGGGTAARQVLQGNTVGASQTRAIQRLNGALPTATQPTSATVAVGSTRPQTQFDDLMRSVPSMLDPQSYIRNPGSLSNERTNRLVDSLSRQTELLYSTMTDVAHLTRIPEEAAAKGFEIAEKEFRRTYPKLEDTIIDVRPMRESAEIFTGTDHIEVLLGKKDATPFSKPEQAEFFASKMYRLPEGSYRVVEQDGNFLLSMTKDIDETALQVRDLRIQTDNAAPETFANQWLGFLRTPDDLLSRRHTELRKQATYGGNAVMQRLTESAKALGSLGKNERDRLGSIMDQARFKKRTIIDTNGQQKQVDGYFYKDVGELEQAYLAKGYQLPTDKELTAYFEFKNIMDWDYFQRNAGQVRDLGRLGVEQKSIGVAQPDPTGKMRYQNTPFFNARQVEGLPPRSSQPYTVAWIDNKTGKADFGISNSLFPAQQKSLDDALASGNYKILQPADPRDEVLGALLDQKGKGVSGGEPVQFVVTRDVKTKPLSSMQIPYNEGGHWNYPQTGTYLKQAKTHRTRFGRRVYDGDVTALYAPATAQGQTFRESYDTARRMLKDAYAGIGPQDLRAYNRFVENNLPYTGPEFARQFRGARGAADDAPFDLDAPFVLTQSGQSVKDVSRFADMFSDEIVDLADSQHSITGMVNSQYTQQRNERLLTIENSGTEANPVYKLDHAPLIDPLESLARNASQMARSRFFTDYQHSVSEDWVTQFADTLDVPIDALRNDPIRYLREPVWKSEYADNAKMAAAKNVRRSVLQILGQDTQEIAAWKWTRQRVVDGIYKAHGNKGVNIVDPLLWDSKTDPAAMIRSVPFHAYLGLFNPVQLFLQGSATTMAMAIDGNPLRAVQSTFAYWGMRNRGLMESNVKAQGLLTKTMSNVLGVSSDDLDEMYDMWRRSGMHIIEGEYSKIDDYLNPRMLYGAKGAAKALDAGLVFFKEGNNMHRGTSFALAFLKHKSDNPGKKISNDDLRRIVERADLMSLNMTRSSNAAWQGGGTLWQKALSVPAQFFAFQVRLAELMMGGGLGNAGRLTQAEKARLMLVNSALWGVPAGTAGAALGFAWPFAESTRQYAIENNIDISEGAPQAAMEGVVSMAVQAAFGENFDVEGRFGPGGLTWMRDLMAGESFEIMGAGPSFLTDAIKQTSPFAGAAIDVFAGRGDPKIVQSTLIDAIRVTSTGNNLVKAFQIWNSGQYLTKGDKPVMNGEAGDPVATIAAALGMTPQEVTDTYLKLRTNKDFAAAKTAISTEAQVWFERGLKAAANGETELTQSFFDRAQNIMATGDFTPLEAAAEFRKAMGMNQDLLTQVDNDFLMNDPSRRGITGNMFDPNAQGGAN